MISFHIFTGIRISGFYPADKYFTSHSFQIKPAQLFSDQFPSTFIQYEINILNVTLSNFHSLLFASLSSLGTKNIHISQRICFAGFCSCFRHN